MGRKKFEETAYDPFEAENRRTLAREVSAASNPLPNVPQVAGPPVRPFVADAPQAASVVTMPRPRPQQQESPPPAPIISNPKGMQKSRTFKCASTTQDKELDAFLLRLSDAAGTSLPFQVIARAAIAATMRSEEQITELIRRRPPMRRPANVSATEYAQFEQYWVEVVVEALRKLRPYQ